MHRFATVIATTLIALATFAFATPASATTCESDLGAAGDAACYVITSGVDCMKENLPTKCI